MLKIVCDENMACFINLSQQYEAEFSILTGKLPDCDGLYQITLPDKSHDGYLYYDDGGNPLGFGVVDKAGERYDMAEFYVVPAMRKNRIGQKMAGMLFDRYPGPWQVRQIEGADHAYRFWNRVIEAYTQGDYTDTVEADAEWGEVRIQKFHVGASD